MITRIVLVRHGNAMTSEEEAETVYRQSKESPLTNFGKLQAEAVAKSVSLYKTEVLFCSQYLRAIKTAEIITKYHPQLFINTDGLLNELVRVVDGVDIYSELNQEYREWRGKMLGSANIHDKFHPSDQSLYEKLKDTLKAIQNVVKKCTGQKIAIIGHSQVFALFLAYIDMINNRNSSPAALVYYFNKRFMDNGAITTVEYDDKKKKWTIVRFNDNRHLP